MSAVLATIQTLNQKHQKRCFFSVAQWRKTAAIPVLSSLWQVLDVPLWFRFTYIMEQLTEREIGNDMETGVLLKGNIFQEQNPLADKHK